jgi:AraC family cel operon transcriptional repressor
MTRFLHWKDQLPTERFFHVAHLGSQIRPFMPLHRHDYGEIFYVERGNGIHKVNGRLQPLARGNLIMIRPLIDSHCIHDPQSNLSILNIAVRASSIRFLETRYCDSSPSFWGGAGKTPLILDLNLLQQEWIQAASQRLEASAQNRLETDRFMLDLMETLCAGGGGTETRHLTDWLRQACEMIHEPRYFVLGTRGFTMLANRSKEHVARELKKCLGVTPTEIVNQARMCYATDKLRSTDLPIIDIALDCGFESLSHFYKIFRTMHRVTPRQYRRNHQALAAGLAGNTAAGALPSRVRAPRAGRRNVKGPQGKIKIKQEMPFRRRVENDYVTA